MQNKQYVNSFRVNPLGSVPNTTVISYKDECIIAEANWVSQAISLRSCERPSSSFKYRYSPKGRPSQDGKGLDAMSKPVQPQHS